MVIDEKREGEGKDGMAPVNGRVWVLGDDDDEEDGDDDDKRRLSVQQQQQQQQTKNRFRCSS